MATGTIFIRAKHLAIVRKISLNYREKVGLKVTTRENQREIAQNHAFSMRYKKEGGLMMDYFHHFNAVSAVRIAATASPISLVPTVEVFDDAISTVRNP